jgi:hypothetical protein
VCDDLVLFRSAVNLLSHAASRNVTGSIRLKIYPLQDQLCFECEDSGPDIVDGKSLFQPGSAEDGSTILELSSIATQSRLLMVNTAFGRSSTIEIGDSWGSQREAKSFRLL